MESLELRVPTTPVRTPLMEPEALVNSLFDVNRRCLELLVRGAQHLDVHHEGTTLVGALQHQLSTLTPAIQATIAHSPFLLVTLSFQDADWWLHVSKHPSSHAQGSHGRRYFPKSAAIRMTRSTLFLAWHATHVAPDFAVVTLGLHSRVLNHIRAINLDAVDQIATHHFARLLPRWEDRPSAWRHLIESAQDPPGQHIQPFNIHGLLLAAGERLSSR